MNKPEVTGRMLQNAYKQVLDMRVALDPDPLLAGPGKLNEKIAQTRYLLDQVERLLNVWLQYSHWYRKAHRTEKLAQDLERDHLIANDPDVRAGRNIRTTLAIANMKLKDRIEELNGLEINIESIDHVLKVLENKKSDLKDTQQRIKDQYRICQDELSIGGRWNHRSRRLSEMPMPQSDETWVRQPSDLDHLLEDMRESDAAPLSDSSVDGGAPESNPKLSVEDADSFLKALPDNVIEGEDLDTVPVPTEAFDLDAMFDLA